MFKDMQILIGNKSFYHKLTTTILLISILPALIISIFSYYNTKVALEKEIINTNIKYLKQTVNAVEIVMKQIDDSCRQITLDSSLRTFEGFPDGKFYEEIKGEINSSDLLSLSRYMEYKSKLFKMLDVFKESNEYIYSVYFYDSLKDIIFVNNGSQYYASEFYDMAWIDIYKKNALFPMFMETRTVDKKDSTEKRVLSVIYKTFNRSFSSANCIVVNLDADFIYQNILKIFNDSTESDVFIINESGKVVFGNGQDLLGSNKNIFKDVVNKTDNLKIKLHNNSALMSYVSSDILNWKFVSIKDVEKLYAGINYIKWVIFIIMLPLLLIIVVFALFLIRNIYKPVSNLLEYLQNKMKCNGKLISDVKSYEEFNIITNSFEQIFNDKEYLERRLLESLPAYREKYIYSLLKSNTIQEEQEKLKMRSLDISLEVHDLFVLVVQPDWSLMSSNDIGNHILVKVNLKENIELLLNEYFNGVVIESLHDNLIIIINCQKDNTNRVFEFAAQIKERIKKSLGLNSTIGIGEYSYDLQSIKKSYEEAKEALNYRILAGNNEVIYINDVRIDDIKAIYYSKEKEKNLCSFIRSGDGENAEKTFTELMKDIFEQNKSLHYRQIQQVFMQLLTGMISITNELNIDTDSVFPVQFYINYIFTEKNIDAIIEKFKEIINILTQYIVNATKTKNSKQISSIENIIESEYGNNISLNYIADKLKLNPAYVSRLFKEKTGKTFLEYLTHMRIEKGKDMLLKTDMMIKDIGEKIGYSNSNYFIKIFKEHTGTTPGEFRNLRNNI